MIPGGYVIFARACLESQLWQCQPDVFKLATYLLMKARFEEKPKRYPGFQVSRGEVLTSLADIAEDCAWFENRSVRKWSRQKVFRLIQKLVDIGFCESMPDTFGTHLKICNFDKYQDTDKYKSDNNRNNSEQLENNPEQPVPNSKNVNNGEECKELPPLPPKGGNCPYEEIINHLNEKTGAKYKTDAKETRRLILARWKGGFSLADFKAVIDRKTAEWLTDPKMCEFLRPATLFGAKFESYLNKPSAQNISAPTTTDKCGDCDCFKDCHRKPTADQPACGRFETDPEAQLKRIQARGKY